MKKKIVFVIILVILFAILSVVIVWNKQEKNKNVESNVENKTVEVQADYEVKEDNGTVEKTEEDLTSIEAVEEEQEEQETSKAQKSNEKKSTVTQKEESNKSVKTEQSENKPQTQVEQTTPTTSNVQEQVPVTQVDEEYERLKKQVEYKTYEECQKAGFEKAFADTVNILGFSCQEIIYKGKVLGYRLHLDYTNPME